MSQFYCENLQPYIIVRLYVHLSCRVTDESGADGRVFSFNMLALVDHLEQQSVQNRLASYFNIDTLKYRVRNFSYVRLLIFFQCIVDNDKSQLLSDRLLLVFTKS